jgi:hypothetical protein
LRYLTGVTNPTIRAALAHRDDVGFLLTPQGNHRLHDWRVWAVDSGCYGKGYIGDEKYLRWLEDRSPFAASCLFACAPDVVGDAAATLERSAPWLPLLRVLGYKAALVAQDGLEHLDVPWDAFDVLFIGGTTDWKLSPAVIALSAEAKRQGKGVHVGRVNSHRRLNWAEAIGADSADGTYLAYGPDVNLPRLTDWLDRLNAERPLWEAL